MNLMGGSVLNMLDQETQAAEAGGSSGGDLGVGAGGEVEDEVAAELEEQDGREKEERQRLKDQLEAAGGATEEEETWVWSTSCQARHLGFRV